MEDEEFYSETRTKSISSESNQKLETILSKLLEPDFKIKSDIYLNLLFTQWVNKMEDGAMTTETYQLNELFFQWIISATNLWDQKMIKPSTPVLSFAVQVCCQLSKNEKLFTKMSVENVFQKLTEVTQESQDLDNCVTIGFITLLSSVLEYAIGVEWLLTTNYWSDVITIALTGRTKFLKKKAYQFIIKLLETTILLNEEFCEALVEILVEPLSEAAVEGQLGRDSEDVNRKMYESLKPSLDLLSEVTDSLLKKFNKKVLNIFFETEIAEAIQNILSISQIEEFSLDLLKIRFGFLFYQVCIKLEGSQQATHDEETLADIRIMFDLIQTEIEKDHVSCLIRICYCANELYRNLDTHLPLCIRKGESIEFQNQMMLFQLVPVMAFSSQLIGIQRSKELLRTDDLRHDFYLKLAKMSAIKTLEIISRWQSRLAGRNQLIEDVSLSLQYILKSKKIINKEQAAFIFRPLTYSLMDTLGHLEQYQEKSMPPRGVKFCSIAIDTIIDLVKSFDLTWKDSLETISLLDLACEIMQYEYFDYQVTVKALQLLNMAISRCMSPNMALLIDNKNDSMMSQVGSMLYTKCHNKSHQIRNAGLEVVYTLSLQASEKFPEFTNVLFNAELPHLVTKMALNDKEHEVRATAIKCMQAMIQIEDIWEVYKRDNNFLDNVLNILIDEPKGTVRKEAAKLICDIYMHYTIPEEVLSRLYDIMTHAAIGDIHWEVKCNALRFWGLTIKKHLMAQGMADKKYPSHTFSKEQKKIIALTKAEITKREIKVLNQLGEIGCLYVLKTAVQDKFDEEVSNITMDITKNMLKMFKDRKITCDNVDYGQPSIPDSSSLSPTSSASPGSNDRRFSLEGVQSQYPDSPRSIDLSPSSDSDMPEDIMPSSTDYNTAPALNKTQKMHYTDIPISYDIIKSQDHDNHRSSCGNDEVEHFDIFNAVMENDLILENDVDIGVDMAENNMETSINDMADTEKMFDELLKLNDSTLLEHIYNPGYQKRTTRTFKTKVYIPPSEYVRFCHEIVDSYERKTTKLTQDLDEFGSVLDDIVKEYDLT